MNYPLIFAENQRIETERLILRPVTLADAEDMYEYASDEEGEHQRAQWRHPLHRNPGRHPDM